MVQDQLHTFHPNGDFVQALINHQLDFLITVAWPYSSIGAVMSWRT